ncbi:NXPE family member 2 [Aplysia californica]|uniref:NXPE family member 2 n=1 Tax=Aplysia californica TaxID=6500 RepID=A0ABM0JRU2_APLCA|nr:NXPE family member 2 [Aplysia californica]
MLHQGYPKTFAFFVLSSGWIFIMMTTLQWVPFEIVHEMLSPALLQPPPPARAAVNVGGPTEQISFFDILKAFEEKSRDSCPSASKTFRSSFCPSGLKNGTCSWPGVAPLRALNAYVAREKPFVPLFADHQYVYQFEQTLLSHPQMKDIREAPSLNLSRLTPLDGKLEKEGVVSCQVGDVIRVRADLVDGYGKARTQGHDDVRGWMVEQVDSHSQKRKLGAVAAADVTDLHNGSYVISYRCLWPGTTSKLNVGVAYPREYQRRVVLERRLGIYRLTSGSFKKGKISEATLCFSTPNIGWPCLCDFTGWNNASFFCGRPRDSRLSCSDLSGIATMTSVWANTNATAAEATLLAQVVRQPNESLIRQDLYVRTQKTGSLGVSQPCRKTRPEVTWSMTAPSGFFDAGRNWHSLLCKAKTFTKAEAQKCLRNTTVRIFGDSNGLQLLGVFKALTGVTCSGAVPIWTVKTVCHRKDLNFRLIFNPHEYHIYLKSSFSPVARYGGVPFQMDAIPSSGRYVVIVHYYLHIVGAHLSVAHNRLLALKKAVRRLLSRNPQAIFVFRGPHIISLEWTDNHSMGGDVQALFYLPIIREVFWDIRDKVIFLDGWEMTTAIENRDIHPNACVPRGMIQLLLSFICD